jgi:hypothetical protein
VGSKKSKSTTESSGWEKTHLPDYILAGSKLAVQMATDRAKKGTEGAVYQGQRVAGLSEREKRGLEMGDKAGSYYKPYFEKSKELLGKAEGSFKDADVKSYMNPYITNVQTDTINRMNDQTARDRSRLDSTAATRDAFGAGRTDYMRGQLDAESQRNVGEYINQSNVAAYESAEKSFESDRQNLKDLAGNYVKQGLAEEDANRAAYQDMMSGGFLERQLEQANLDWDYTKFLENRDWDVRNLDVLVATLNQTPYEQSRTYGEKSTTKTKQSSGALGQIIGAAVTIAAAYFTGGASLAAQAAVGAAAGAAAPSS